MKIIIDGPGTLSIEYESKDLDSADGLTAKALADLGVDKSFVDVVGPYLRAQQIQSSD